MIAVEVLVAIGLLLWVRSLGWGFIYLVAVLWTLRIDDDRIRWAVEAVVTVVSLIFLPRARDHQRDHLRAQRAAAPVRRRSRCRSRRSSSPSRYPFYVDHLFTIPVFGAFPDVNTGVVMVVFIMMAVGLNIVVGYAGLLDLGYVAFYAMGAYTMAWLTSLAVPERTRSTSAPSASRRTCPGSTSRSGSCSRSRRS